MSRIGKKPIKVPSGVKVTIRDSQLEVEGKTAKLSALIPPGIRFELNGDTLTAIRTSDEKPYPAYHGLARALAANCILDVTEGFSKNLDLVGIGYKVEAKPKASDSYSWDTRIRLNSRYPRESALKSKNRPKASRTMSLR